MSRFVACAGQRGNARPDPPRVAEGGRRRLL